MVGVDLVGDHRVLRRLAQVALLAELERRCGAVAQVRDPGGVESHRLGREVVAELTSPCFTYSTHLTYFTHCT